MLYHNFQTRSELPSRLAAMFRAAFLDLFSLSTPPTALLPPSRSTTVHSWAGLHHWLEPMLTLCQCSSGRGPHCAADPQSWDHRKMFPALQISQSHPAQPPQSVFGRGGGGRLATSSDFYTMGPRFFSFLSLLLRFRL